MTRDEARYFDQGTSKRNVEYVITTSTGNAGELIFRAECRCRAHCRRRAGNAEFKTVKAAYDYIATF